MFLSLLLCVFLSINMMTPVFPGAPCVPKFEGPDSELKYGE